MARKPIDQRVRIADGRGKANALKLPAGQALDTLDDSEQVKPAIIPGEGMDFIDDHHPHIDQQLTQFPAARNHHHLQRLGRR